MKIFAVLALLLSINAQAEIQIGNQLIKTSDECIQQTLEVAKIGFANDQCGGKILPITTDQFSQNADEISLRNGCSAYETNINHMMKMAAKVKSEIIKLKPVRENPSARAKFCEEMMEETKDLRN